MKLRLIVSVLFLAMLSTSCATLSPGSTTQPVTNADQIAAAIKVYDGLRARADAFAAIAMGLNPTQAKVDDYNRALFFLDAQRQILVLLGAPSPADTPPYVQLVGGHVVPLR